LRKVIIILLLPVFVAGCSVIGRSGKSLAKDYINPIGSNILESTKNQNITNSGFFIQKAEIEILSNGGREKYLASIKFERPDRYLISLKSRTGIEGARIYMTNDSILVNDRINKKLYTGNTFYLKKKFGMTPEFMPLIFGDVILDKNCEKSNDKCVGSRIITECHVKGVILNYEIDCNRRKIVTVSQIDNFDKNVIKLRFESFFRIGRNLIPKIIEFDDSQFNTEVKIKIIKVELPWSGSLKFIPGKGYELIELV
jgi:hypothetical protein